MLYKNIILFMYVIINQSTFKNFKVFDVCILFLLFLSICEAYLPATLHIYNVFTENAFFECEYTKILSFFFVILIH